MFIIENLKRGVLLVFNENDELFLLFRILLFLKNFFYINCYYIYFLIYYLYCFCNVEIYVF